MAFETKDSGQRIDLANGMVRDNRNGKPDYTLILKGPLHKRWAELLSRGAAKYGKHNWCKALASTDTKAREETKERFKESAIGHMIQWLNGERDEDHAAAVIFNMNGYEAMLETDHVALPVTVDLAGGVPSDRAWTINDLAVQLPNGEVCSISKPCRDCQISNAAMADTIADDINAQLEVGLLDKELAQGFAQSAYKPGMEPR